MSKTGPFIIIDDNKKDQLLYQIALQNLNVHNSVYFFEDSRDALEYLETAKENPFMILCDINIPQMEGKDLRQHIAANPNLRKKATPFVFMSSAPTSTCLKDAYEHSVQGFFKKTNAAGLERILALQIEYWSECIDPHSHS